MALSITRRTPAGADLLTDLSRKGVTGPDALSWTLDVGQDRLLLAQKNHLTQDDLQSSDRWHS
jgi:hypothetical protein